MKVTNDGFCEPCLGCRPSLLAAGIKLHPPSPRNGGLSSLFHARETRLDFIDDRNEAIYEFYVSPPIVPSIASDDNWIIRSKMNVHSDD